MRLQRVGQQAKSRIDFKTGTGKELNVNTRGLSKPRQRLIREYRIGGDGQMLPSQAPATDEWLQKLGSLPWLAQPGERWMYHVSGDVLGALIARVSGQSRGSSCASASSIRSV
jgi:hypothetical protein